jgi:DME family drug/metabolite transporter
VSLSTHLRARTGLLAVSGGALLWGTTGVAVRIIHDRSGLAAVPIGAYRLLIAAFALALVFGRSGVSRTRASWLRHRWSLVLSGAGLGIYQALYFIGVQYVGVSVSTLVSLAVAPVAITVVTSVRARRWPSWGAALTLGCAIGGLALIALASGSATASAPHPILGIIASLGSGLGYAATTLLNRRLVRDGEPLFLTATTSAIGGVVLLPLAIPLGMAVPSDAIADGWLIYIGLVSTVAAYGLFYAGLRSVLPEVAGVLTLLEPLAATVLAAIFLHETLTHAGMVGAALLLIAITVLYARKPEPAAPVL